jgi:hypothetical protein
MRSKEEIVATISTTSPHVRDRRMERLGGRFDSPTVRERPNKKRKTKISQIPNPKRKHNQKPKHKIVQIHQTQTPKQTKNPRKTEKQRKNT